MTTEYTRADLLQANLQIARIQDERADLLKQLDHWLRVRDDAQEVIGYMDTDNKQCLECGWSGDISECIPDKQESDHVGSKYINVPLCPKCGSEHIAVYESDEFIPTDELE